MSQWFFSMRTPKPGSEVRRMLGYGNMTIPEKRALSDALNPFARENAVKAVQEYLETAFREASEEFDNHLLHCRMVDAYRMGINQTSGSGCGKCDECVFRATGAYPDRQQTFDGFTIRTDCRMKSGMVKFKPLPDCNEVKRQWASTPTKPTDFFSDTMPPRPYGVR